MGKATGLPKAEFNVFDWNRRSTRPQEEPNTNQFTWKLGTGPQREDCARKFS